MFNLMMAVAGAAGGDFMQAGLLEGILGFLQGVKVYAMVFIGFSVVIFFHELGHFLAAKWCDVRVDKFAVGFGRELFGFTRGETRYSFNVLPLGGYVKMMGQDDFEIDKSGEIRVKDNPRSFTHKPIGQRMIIVSAGVIMNLIFAAVLFMGVFMVGVDTPPAVVGMILPDSPADRAGMQIGDRIVQMNNKPVSDFEDAYFSILFSDPESPISLTVERKQPDGEVKPVQLTIFAEKNAEEERLMIGVAPAMNNIIVRGNENPKLAPEERLQPGDEIIAIDGQPVSSYFEIVANLSRKRGEWANLTVRRPDASRRGPARVMEVKSAAHAYYLPTSDDAEEASHLAGFVPRRRVSYLEPNGGAAQAGLRVGDVIARWGEFTAPTFSDVQKAVRGGEGKPIQVVVERWNGERYESHEFTVRPKWSGLPWKGTWKAGVDLSGQEEDQIVVSMIVPEIHRGKIPTPAASVKSDMPLGARITHVNDQPVETWHQLFDQFLKLAGNKVKISWMLPGGPPQSGSIYIPQTLGTVFDLPGDHVITKIDGQNSIRIEENGNIHRHVAMTWMGAMEMLRRKIGKTIEIEHRGMIDSKPHVEKITVLPEMLDTWVMRVKYLPDFDRTGLMMTKVQERNPLAAMMLGIKKTWHYVEQVYLIGKRMLVTKSVSMDQVSGPVGIVKQGGEIAEQDFTKLLLFLGMISANLAVINFLPFPIVDGGLFVFLIIEKLKGSPLSLKFQMVTQVIGLAVIISIFIYVTFNDIYRIIG